MRRIYLGTGLRGLSWPDQNVMANVPLVMANVPLAMDHKRTARRLARLSGKRPA